mmetsp:Transcript_91429/g.293694  ORF Transcript_91429/g.293694 Transcript_91429/m.293694 type:complete len:264 (+) Transcript_91429:170-961(+)
MGVGETAEVSEQTIGQVAHSNSKSARSSQSLSKSEASTIQADSAFTGYQSFDAPPQSMPCEMPLASTSLEDLHITICPTSESQSPASPQTSQVLVTCAFPSQVEYTLRWPRTQAVSRELSTETHLCRDMSDATQSQEGPQQVSLASAGEPPYRFEPRATTFQESPLAADNATCLKQAPRCSQPHALSDEFEVDSAIVAGAAVTGYASSGACSLVVVEMPSRGLWLEGDDVPECHADIEEALEPAVGPFSLKIHECSITCDSYM